MASRIVLFTTVLMSAVPAACHYSEAKEPDPVSYRSDDDKSASKERAESDSESASPSDRHSSGEPVSAASNTCEDQACVGAEDCCKGYQCGFDPERSHVQRYCQPQ